MKVVVLSIAILFIAGCTTAPFSGRSQIKLVSERALRAESFSSYREVISGETLSANAVQTALLKDVGNRIARAVELYLQQEQLLYLVDGFQWEFNLIESDIPNAWCMPGVKWHFTLGFYPIRKMRPVWLW